MSQSPTNDYSLTGVPDTLLTESGEVYEIPAGGSLGLLALGYTGVMLWRQQKALLCKQIADGESKNTSEITNANA